MAASHRTIKSSLLVSPNSVLANALLRSIDLLRPRVLAARPARIEFVVGTQVNGAPHLGANLVQTTAFLLAKLARREFSIDTRVRFGALDNAPLRGRARPGGTHRVPADVLPCARQGQGQRADRELLPGVLPFALRSHRHRLRGGDLHRPTGHTGLPRGVPAHPGTTGRHPLVDGPSHGIVHIRVPCPECGWAEKRADRTKLAHLDEDGATFTAVCFDHGDYEAHIDPEGDQPYLALATLYRNLVKERALGRDPDVLHVMMKGGDWAFGCQLVDGALGALDTPATQLPSRIFTPQVLAPTGTKLSKSLLREQGKGVLPADVEPWMLDTTAWPGSVDDYVDALVWLVGELLTDPKHFFRSFTVKELGRLMAARPITLPVRAHEMGIYKRYFDLIAQGKKTTEIRVNDSSRKKIKEGSLIRFRCQGDEVLTRVTRIARYRTFEEMFDHESVASVNPFATREEQLANIRQIYPPEREALGVVAIGVELADPSRLKLPGVCDTPGSVLR